MEKRIVPTDSQEIDAAFLVRLFLGAQSEHEQRLLAVRLLRRDAVLRAAVAAVLEPFEMFDLDLVTEYERALRREPGDGQNLRHRILSRAFARADLEDLLRNFTYTDLLELGEATRKIFSWSMAEMLLQRTGRVGASEYEVNTSLYLALMIIDVVEILGVTGRSPEFPAVIRDVRRRIKRASRSSFPPGRPF